MSTLQKIKKDLIAALEASQPKTRGYDTTAEILSIDDDRTAWIHIPGGAEETPVELSIDAKPGDTVQVRVSGGRAWITGNNTRPPTDDATAIIAKTTAETAVVAAAEAQADIDAELEYFWHDDSGAHVLGSKSGYRNDIKSDGMHIVDVASGVELATFGTETSICTDDGTELVHFGYASGEGESSTETAPYYTLGTRSSSDTPGNYSMAEGKSVIASGYCAHAEGRYTQSIGKSAHAEGINSVAYGANSHAEGNATIASGANSHAQNLGTVARSANQTVLGKYNVEDSDEEYALIIGNGTEDTSSNALTVDWDGQMTIEGHSSPIGSVVSESNSSAISIATSTGTEITSVTLDPGVWVLVCNCRFTSNSSGVRRLNISTSSGATSWQVSLPAASAIEELQLTRILTPTSSTTYYLNAWQNSGSALTCAAGYGTIEAVRIA